MDDGTDDVCKTCGADVKQAHVSQMRLAGGGDNYHTCVPGMVCSSWGAPMWYCMHMTARNFPEYPDAAQKHQYLAWLTSHQHTLPCCCCRSHFGQHMRKHKLVDVEKGSPDLTPFATTRTFFNFVCTLHNDVNESIGRRRLPDEDFDKLYTFYGASQCSTTENYGRAFVVIEPGLETSKVLDSIYASRSVAERGCRFLGLVASVAEPAKVAAAAKHTDTAESLSGALPTCLNLGK